MTQEEKINQLFVDMFWKDSKKQIATLLIGKGIRLDREIKPFSFVAYCSKRKQDVPYQYSICTEWLCLLYLCRTPGVYRKMHPSGKTDGKEGNLSQCARAQIAPLRK
jgi:hypothetical protein